MIRRFAPLLLPLVLAAPLTACIDGRDVSAETANNSAEPHISIRNEVHDALLRAQPLYQRLELMRAIRATGHRCVRVDNAGYQEEYRNMRLWVAECGVEGKTWQIYIAANRDVQVRDCTEAGQLGLPRCQPLPPAAPVPEFNAPPVNISEPIPNGNRMR